MAQVFMDWLRKGVSFLLGCLSFVGLNPTEAAQVTIPSATIIARTQIPTVSINKLPPQAKATIDLIKRGGPYPYEKDGTVFGNFERKLPIKQRGYYHEYTVPTPRARNRGARRIVTGQQGEFYYTGDHYKTFARVKFDVR